MHPPPPLLQPCSYRLHESFTAATVAFVYLANVAINGQPPLIPEDYGFFYSFSLPTLAFVIGISCFFFGRHRYVMLPPQGSALETFVRTLAAAGGPRYRALTWAVGLLPASFVVITAASFLSGGAELARPRPSQW